jgi:hypothetical protein
MIELTPDQRAELERQRSAVRSTVKLTPQQRAEFDRMVAAEDAARAENIDRFRKLQEAKREAGFSGALRRAISADPRTCHELAVAAHIHVRSLESFRTGDATLPSDAIDRLVETLHLRLMAEVS